MDCCHARARDVNADDADDVGSVDWVEGVEGVMEREEKKFERSGRGRWGTGFKEVEEAGRLWSSSYVAIVAKRHEWPVGLLE